MANLNSHFFALLRFSLGIDRNFTLRPTAGEWMQLYEQACKQRLVVAALMWVLAETLHLPEEQMITTPDRRRGRWLLDHMLGGANFEWYTMPRYGAWQRFATGRRQAFSLIWFCPGEAHRVVCQELQYWRTLFINIPQRIRYRKLSLNGLQIKE